LCQRIIAQSNLPEVHSHIVSLVSFLQWSTGHTSSWSWWLQIRTRRWCWRNFGKNEYPKFMILMRAWTQTWITVHFYDFKGQPFKAPYVIVGPHPRIHVWHWVADISAEDPQTKRGNFNESRHVRRAASGVNHAWHSV
jgi:hypothetical protein